MMYLLPAHAQIGTPIIRYYDFKEYDGHPQVWTFEQDTCQRLIFGTGNGIVIYDASSWKKIQSNTIRCLKADPRSNRIYYSGKDDFGFISEGYDSLVSIKTNLPDQIKFINGFKVQVLDSAVLFFSFESIIIWTPQTFNYLLPKEKFQGLFEIEGIVYVKEAGSELRVIEGGELIPLKGTESLNNFRFIDISKTDNGNLLITTESNGSYLYNEQLSVTKEHITQATDTLRTLGPVTDFLKFSNGKLAWSTLKGFLVIADSNGYVIHVLSKNSGLPSTIYSLNEGSDGSLWVGSSQGISNVKIQLPYTIWEEGNDIEGVILDIARFKNDLYISTVEGLYKFDSQQGFIEVAGIPSGFINALLVDEENDKMLVSHPNGVYEINKSGQASHAYPSDLVMSLAYINLQSGNYLVVGKRGGIDVLTYQTDGLRPLRKFRFDGDVREIIFHADRLWLRTGSLELFSISVSDIWEESSPIKMAFDFDEVWHVQKLKNDLIITTNKGIFRYDQNEIFSRDSEFAPEFNTQSKLVFKVRQDDSDNIWLTWADLQSISNSRLAIISSKEDGFSSTYLSPISNNTYQVIFHEDETTWLGGNSGLVRVDRSRSRHSPSYSPALILNEIYLGELRCYTNDHLNKVNYKYNDLTVKYTLTDYINESENEFRYKLTGLNDEKWSEWSTESTIMISNLREGNYSLEVEGRNLIGVTKNVRFDFGIHPPWQRSNLAYAVYALLMVLITYSIVRLNSARLKRQNKTLEENVRLRTKELIDQKEEIELQNLKLKKMNYERDQLLQVVVHDLKNPLISIQNAAQLLQYEFAHERKIGMEKLQFIENHAHKLTEIIDNTLELSISTHEHVHTKFIEVDLIKVIKDVIALNDRIALEKEIKIIFEQDEGNAVIQSIKYYLTQVIDNLLSNAIKFSKKGTTVTVRLKGVSDRIRIEFMDQGPGVIKSEIPKLFEKYSRLSARPTANEPSTGLGLYIVKSLTELLRGSVYYDIEFDSGAKFVLEFQRHLSS